MKTIGGLQRLGRLLPRLLGRGLAIAAGLGIGAEAGTATLNFSSLYPAYSSVLIPETAISKSSSETEYRRTSSLIAQVGWREEYLRLRQVGAAQMEAGNLEQALESFQQLADLAYGNSSLAAADAHMSIGQVYDAQSQYSLAVEQYTIAIHHYNQALLTLHPNDVSLRVPILQNIEGMLIHIVDKGDAYLDAEEYQQRISNMLLTIAEVADDYFYIGEYQRAINAYRQAERRSQLIEGEQHMRLRAQISLGIGEIYFLLEDIERAWEYFNQAHSLFQDLGDSRGETLVVQYYLASGTPRDEDTIQWYIQTYDRILEIHREDGDQLREAYTLANFGLMYQRLDELEEARSYYQDALNLLREINASEGSIAAEIFRGLGYVYYESEDYQLALEQFNQALDLARELNIPHLEIKALGSVAATYRKQGNFVDALDNIQQATDLIENSRYQFSNRSLQTAFFSIVQGYYQIEIHALMELGREEDAFNTSEKTRARALTDLLAESNLNLSENVELPPDLLQRLQALEEAFQELESERTEHLENGFAENSEFLEERYEDLLEEEEVLASEIRQTNPSFADLKYPEPLTVEQVQREVLDDETVLLQYQLGEDESYVWAVSHSGEIVSHVIPAGHKELTEKIETFLGNISSSGTIEPNARTIELGQEILSTLISPEIADQLQGKERLLIVADGILHYLPFGALPIVDVETYTPLIERYEIVNAPSATAIYVSRQQFENREPAPKALAMVADPVFSRDDPRLPFVGGEREPCRRLDAPRPDSPTVALENAPTLAQDAMRSANRSDIEPLPCTSEEAEQILGLIDDPSQTTLVTGLDATYDWVTSPDSQLDQYRIVQFATHGIYHEDNPALSGLVLSLVDENGETLPPGFLQLRDIFNLKLNADLVVLSACETGLGEEIPGEGIIGLTRGFMYAGTKRVMTSLWSVSDPATAELMTLFYEEVLDKGASPSAALREAQRAMWRKYKDPYLWAAFTIQGDWRD